MVTNNTANFGTGTAGQILTSNGTGVAPTFQAAPVSGITGTTTQYDVIVGAGASSVGSVGPGSAGQVLQSAGNASNPAYSTPTYPSTSGSAGKILISDGTNNIYSTPTYPNTSGSSGKILISDGTNNIYSTPTYPNSASSTGTILRADGTNWTATTATFPATSTLGDTLYASANNVYSNLAISSVAGSTLEYNGTNVSWFNVLQECRLYEDFVCGTNIGTLNWRSGNTGTVSAVNSQTDVDSGHPGVVQLKTGTDTTGAAFLQCGGNGSGSPFIVGGGAINILMVVKIPTLSTGTDTFSVVVGLTSSANANAPTNGIYFSYNDTGALPNWYINTNSASSNTHTNSTIATGTGWTTLGININAAGTSVAYTINGSTVAAGPITTNIPSSSIGPYISILKSAGSNSRVVDIDLFYLYQNLTSAR